MLEVLVNKTEAELLMADFPNFQVTIFRFLKKTFSEEGTETLILFYANVTII